VRRDYYNRYIWKPALKAAGLMAARNALDGAFAAARAQAALAPRPGHVHPMCTGS
jgi:hypothetical protein